MEYPVYINGREAGKLTVRKEGLVTCFEADCEYAEGIIRLWVRGEGCSAPLGVLRPENGRLKLSKRFTKNQLRSFPKTVCRVGDKVATAEKASPPECEKASDAPRLLWVQTPHGTLTAFDGENTLLAIPTAGKLRCGRTISIGGRPYMVFASKRNLR